ncbi:flagellar type III secretion system pore protein FliP [Salinisphaera sp. RV14]|uniref:flagellar type III secretion system pore protein FliP n=1 Tax=unclassified Salinisphaera TaxID=2649847 RepID=UPI003F861378
MSRTSRWLRAGLAVLLFATPWAAAWADPSLNLMNAQATGQGTQYSLNVQTLLIITALAFLPAIVLLMSSFLRIVVVLAILRQALGLSQTPPNLVLVGLALALTMFVMRPVINNINDNALQPYLNGNLGFKAAIAKGEKPLRQFMTAQTRKREMQLFVTLDGGHYANLKQIPFTVLVPAYATSELQTAFQIGFLIWLPFVLIDLAVSAVLMSLGMIMLSPMLISSPLKLLLFVMIDGWSLVLGSLARSIVH